MSEPPNLYIAEIMSRSSRGVSPPLFQEDFVLIKGGSPEDAIEKAKAQAKAMAVEYDNAYGETVSVVPALVSVCAVVDQALDDGSTVHTRWFRNVEAYKQLEFESFTKDM